MKTSTLLIVLAAAAIALYFFMRPGTATAASAAPANTGISNGSTPNHPVVAGAISAVSGLSSTPILFVLPGAASTASPNVPVAPPSPSTRSSIRSSWQSQVRFT